MFKTALKPEFQNLKNEGQKQKRINRKNRKRLEENLKPRILMVLGENR